MFSTTGAARSSAEADSFCFEIVFEQVKGNREWSMSNWIVV